MTTDDIICGLEALNALVRDPVTGYYALRLDHALFEAQIERWEAKGYIKLNPKALIWTPYLMGRSQAEHLNEMPLTTIAPRAGELPRDPKNDHETAGEQRDEVMKLNPLLAAHDALAAPDGGMNGRISQLTDSIDPTLIANRPVPQLVSSIDNTQSQEFLSQLREIPPTRFEIVPPPPGSAVQRRAGVFRGTGRGRGRPRLASPAVRGTGKGRYGATPATATRRTGKTKLADVESVAATPAPKPRRIVTKAPRMRSLTADLARAGSTSEGSLRGGGKGNIKSVSGVVAAAATSTASSSSSSSVSSSSSSASASTDGI